jgi:hypothetical protein
VGKSFSKKYYLSFCILEKSIIFVTNLNNIVMERILVFMFIGIFFVSCSDKISSLDADKIVKKNLEENPIYGSIDFMTGIETEEISFSDEEKNILKKLQGDGYINIQKVMRKSEKTHWDMLEQDSIEYYVFSLTDKAKNYILETKETKSYNGSFMINKMRTYTTTLDKVKQKQIYVNDKNESAEAIAIYSKNDRTPFYVFERDQTPFFAKKIRFVKTIDNGWILDKK